MLATSLCRRGWCLLLAACFASTTRGDETERLAVLVLDVEKGLAQSVAREPIPDHSYCGSPSWSADGQRIIIDATPGKVWSKSHVFAGDNLLLEKPAFADLGPGNCPTWSPDGKRVAFLLNPGAVEGATSGIWIMNADGTERQRLGGNGMPKWSPDGKQILTVSFSNPCQLSLLDVQTGAEQLVAMPGLCYSVPSWAGDGQRLIAVIRSEGPLSLALLDISNPAQAKVKQVLWTRGNGLDAEPLYPVYSAAARRCVFVGRGAKGLALYVLDAERKGVPQPLEQSQFDTKIASTAISLDGRRVLFCSDRLNQPPRAKAP
jgi:Tol biopolymer transport system component